MVIKTGTFILNTNFNRYLYGLMAGIFSLLSNYQTTHAQDKHATADTVNTIPDTLLFKIQQAQAAITDINSANKKGYRIDGIRNGLEEIITNVNPVKSDLAVTKKVIDTKSLLSYNLILKDAQSKLTDWQTRLTKLNSELQQRADKVVALSNDSLLTVDNRDTTQKRLYSSQLANIKLRLQGAGKVTSAGLDTISQLLADVSALYLTVNDMQSAIDERLQQSGRSALGREAPYIWSAPAKSQNNDLFKLISSSFEGQNKILGYFFDSSWDNRVLLLLAGIAFYIWVFRNFKKIRQTSLRDKVGQINFKYISPYPVLATIMLVLNLAPLFEPDAPSLYIELTQFLSLAVLTVLFWRDLSKNDIKYWVFVTGLYIVIVLTTSVVQDAVWMRLWLMGLNVFAIYTGILFTRRLREEGVSQKLTKPVLYIFVLLNGLAVILNIFGRISLAKVYSTTAIIGLTQIIGLAIFIQILSDALELQIKVSACSEGLFSRISVSRSRASFKKALTVVAVILWLLVFMINLSIAGGIYAFTQQVLIKERAFGSVKFTLSNVLFFAVIVYLANILQKHVGVLFGEGGTSSTISDKIEHKGSKLALIRLVIIIIGVLLAITASGIPLDKLTVVLGALSVGIGLGMQNIVNNFVSGIILIFEKPFRIGDYVELADKKGKVQDIGIRSSKMLTPQGSEVIIPNGDLLSGRLVNWTLSNDYLKTEIVFKVGIDTDLEAIKKIIDEEVNKTDDRVKNLPPELLINSFGADSIELKILVWITNIYAEAGFKSRLLQQLLTRFKEIEIKTM
ncbi:mechanosensitive ion channel [Mucilaginibacter sp. UR6-1]|uniref:mechanosensitive ion channel family protein n=1 Tax=Mucilaginibacter sp. UR6-1 TaxID=1435643 RepID=UPI001E34FB19|nr:mechanosensitive ion channel domain-containing protein [Mucilaginibacter sp. UR6-1]MCC8409042.1 mechanosensitive ion channel [Mucilaginibacter sp. UR6-1]